IPGLAAMQPGAPIPLFSKLPADWGEEIAEIEGVSVVMSEVWQRINVVNGEMIFNRPKMWLGYDIESGQSLEKNVYADSIIRGRDLEPRDRGTTRCLVSEQISEEYEVGLGDELSINGFPHEIVGIYRTGSLLLDVA